jgi:hypothetical protein
VTKRACKKIKILVIRQMLFGTKQEKNMESAGALLLDWQLYHRVLQIQKISPSDRWFKVTHPLMDLI